MAFLPTHVFFALAAFTPGSRWAHWRTYRNDVDIITSKHRVEIIVRSTENSAAKRISLFDRAVVTGHKLGSFDFSNRLLRGTSRSFHNQLFQSLQP